jgi:hypothetical protein
MLAEPKTFIELAMNGEAVADEIEDFIENWHESSDERPLYTYLGMTRDEYSLWLNNADNLSLILSARHRGQPLIDAVNDNYLAAQVNTGGTERTARASELRDWLGQFG